jgi:hypothetical protein
MTTDLLVGKLIDSFDDLDKCIEMTKQVLSQKVDIPSEVIERINQYTGIVVKQRVLAENLRDFISNQNWDEVSRHVKIINGLSSMIRDDAQAILAGAHRVSDKDKNNFLV